MTGEDFTTAIPKLDSSALRKAAEELIGAGKYRDALRLLERVPEDENSCYLKGFANYKSGDINAAHRFFSTAVEHTRTARGLYALGLTYRDLKQRAEARRAFESALSLNPEMNEARERLAELDSLPPDKPSRTAVGGSATSGSPSESGGSADRVPTTGKVTKLGPVDSFSATGPSHAFSDVGQESPESGAGPFPTAGASPNSPDSENSEFGHMPSSRKRTGSTKVQGGASSLSLADLLDFRGSRRPNDEDLAGRIVWTSRPSLRFVLAWALAGLALTLVPTLFRGLVERIPAGLLGYLAVWVWRILEAWAVPVAIFLLIRAATLWFTRYYVLRLNRIEISGGFLNQQQVVIWLHDIERPVVINQNLLQLIAGTASVVIHSTALPSKGKKKLPDQPGQILLADLPVGVAVDVAAQLRSGVMWQRRRMIQSFVSSR